MAINFLNNGVFAGDVTIPEYIYHSGDINTYLGFSANDEFLVVAGGSNKFAADANAAYMYYQGSLKLQTTSTGISISGQATGTFSGDISTSGSGQTNTPFRLGADYNSYMVAAAGTTWGLFWAGNSGARYGTNGNGGPGNIWGNNGNPNEFVFVGGDSTRWTVYGGSGDTWQSGNIYVGGGEIILSSTGRIQGVDTVSANTDAANKLYVDNAISGVPQGTVTISGTPVDNQLAVWTSATSIEGEAELTYDGSTFTVGGSGNTTTYLDVIGTNTAGAPARAAAIRIYGYEGRGEGIFYYDSAYASSEWYSGIPYGGGDTWQIGHDTGGQAEYTANAILRFTTAGAATFVGDININSTIPRINFTDLQQDDWAIINDNGEFKFQCTSGSGVALLLDTSNNATFAGNVLIPSNLQHVNDDNNEISFTTDAQDFRTNNVSRLDISNSGVRFGGSNARVTTVLDQDNMSSNSATALATQQSIKQYVDTAFSNAGTVTGTGSSGRVAFWNGTSSIASNSTLSWDDSNAELGIGTSSATTSLTIARGHSNTRANLYYFDASNIRKAYIDMWASEPGVSYNGSGIGSNINGSPYYGRKVTEQGQTYIRFIDGQFEVYTGTNSSGTGSTAARRFYIEDNGLSTFSTTPEVGTRSAGDNTGRAASTAFVTTAIGNVNTGVQSVSDDGGSTINVSGSSTARVVAAITGAVSSSSANLATGAQIQTAINTAIGTIPSGLAFEGNWDASTGNPPSSSPSNGQFWIVTVAGSTNLSGITDWKVGDWAIYVEQGAGTDAWQKVDNTSTLSGDGVANQLTYWTSTSNVAGDTGLTYDASANKLTVAGNLSAAGYNIFGLGLSTGTWYGDLGSNGYTRETGLAMTGGSEFVVLSKNGQGSTLVDGAYLAYESANGFFGSYNSSYGNLTGIQATAANTLTVKQLDGGTANLAITSIANATTDTDKFLVSNSGVVQYRTGAQVLSDIGAQASGNYLPVANPAFTGTLTGPAITITGDATVAGATISGDTYSDPDLLLSVLSVDTNTSLRNKIGNSTSMTMVSDSTAPAPGVFEVSGSYYPDPFGQYYTIDEGDTFTFEFWYKFQSGTATYNLLYAGSNFYNAAGSSLGNVNRYWGESALNINANSGSNWYHVTGTLGPDRGTSVGDIPATAVSMRLLFLFNYAKNGTAVTRFCGLKVYKSGQTVTQLYRKTLGSEANTTRNRDLVVDANGDLYGSKINATDNVTFAAGLQVTSPGSAFYNRFRSGNDYVIGLQDSLGDDEWWLKAYTNGAFALHENNVGDKFTIAAGGNATFSDQLTINTISNASASNTFLVSDSGVIKYRNAAQVLSDIGAASSGSLGNYLPLIGGTMSGTIVSTATTALEMDGAASAQGVVMQADSSGTYPVFLRSLNPASGGETSAWLFKEESAPWGIWHNNPVNSFDFTRSGNNLGIANNVGGLTNSVMIRLTASDGTGTFGGGVNVKTNKVQIDQDGTYGSGYGTVAFGGKTNGYNRVFGNTGTADGLFLASATGKGIFFRVNGGSTDNVSFNPDGSATFGGGVTLSGVNNTYNFKALATDTDSWFGVYEDANNSANIILTRSDGTVMFKILGHTGVATFAGTINAGRIVTSGLYGTGHSGSILPIWQYNAGNPGYGIGYEESSPDRLRMDVSNNLMSGTPDFELIPNELRINGNKVWNAGNDGAGSGLDADLLDGQNGSYYASASSLNNYLPLAGGTLTGGLIGTSVDMTGGIDANQGMFNNIDGLRLINPGGGSSVGQTSTVTGAIKITLPVTHTNTMMRMTIKVYEYTTNESFTVVCGGYNYSSGNTWYNCFAHIESNATKDRNFTVRFGYGSSKGQIYIGELNSQWSYPQVFVTDFQAGYSSYVASSWQTGWDVNFETSAFGSVTRSITNAQVNNWARDGVNLSYTSGSGNVLVTTQAASDNSTRAASTAYVTTAVATGVGNYLPLAGGTMTGAITMNDNVPINFGTGGSSDSRIFYDALDLNIESQGGKIFIVKDVTDLSTGIVLDSSSNVAIGAAGGASASGAKLTVTGNTYVSGTIQAPDNGKLAVGNSLDLQIYHNGSNSFIETTSTSTGDFYITARGSNHDLYLEAADDIYIRPQGNESGIDVIGNGAVSLYHNNVLQLNTTSTGISTNTIDATVAAGSAGNFVVMDGTRLAYRTAAQVLSDIGGTSSSGVTSVATTAPILGGTITSTGTISLKSPVSGNWHNGGAPVVGTDGLMEIGRYIDFHTSNTGTSDYDVRLNATSGLLTVTGSVSSSSNITSTGNMQSSYIRCTSSGTRFAPTFSFTSDTNTGMFRNGTDEVALSAGGNTRVLCTSTYVKLDGNVGIGRVPSTKLDIDGTVLVKDGTGLGDLYLGNLGTNNHFRFHTNNSNTYFDMNCGNMYWRQGSSIRYTFFPSTANMTINGTLTQNSDVRRKENIVEIKDCISKVKAMRGVYYNRTDINTEVTKVGVIAQEVEAVLPEVILESPEDGLKSVAYSELTSVLINAIKEQQEIIEDLKTRITKLEN